ncbi:hypothetical protein TI04_11145 [Achromatium sp. WMS2]|nr:hypothetical protein TI04_11145 [Achromatium sp. WMS2]
MALTEAGLQALVGSILGITGYVLCLPLLGQLSFNGGKVGADSILLRPIPVAGVILTLVLVTATVAAGLASTVPAPVRWADAVSPLNPALRAVQAVVAGQNPAFGSLVAVVAWAVVALVASMGAVGRRRQTSAKALLGSG